MINLSTVCSKGWSAAKKFGRRYQRSPPHYLGEIRRLQPEGPYLIAGYCFGGLVAYEMAQQLQAAGETVAPLLLIEAEAPGGIYPINTNIIHKLRRAAGRIRSAGLSGEMNYLRQRLYNFWHWQIWHRLRRYLHHLYEAAGRELPDALKDVLQINAQAADAYAAIIKPYRGDIYLLRAELMAPDYHYKDSLGWDKLVEGAVKTYWLPGDHEGIWKTPNVQRYAQQLKQILEGDEKAAERPTAATTAR